MARRKDPTRKALEQAQTLRAQGTKPETQAALLELLQTQPGIVVREAARLAADWQLKDLAAALEAAFDRLSEQGRERDPQCLGKLALIRSLHELAWQDATVFLKACRTVQLEPVFGGQEDSATGVRIAALGVLTQLPSLPTAVLMTQLVDLLSDDSAKVRSEAARASVFCPLELTSPLLRLKIRCGDAEPRVLGACFDALLALDPNDESVELIGHYADAQGTVLQAEALASLASSNAPAAVEAALMRYAELNDKQLKRVLVTALGGASTGLAVAFLLELVEAAPPEEARWSLEALKPRRHDETLWRAVLERLQKRQDDELSSMGQI